ncbi:AraC family transcriptional regulator [Marinobacteraceae bacterium S3BR75-40.1]
MPVSRQEPRDIVQALTQAGAAPRRLLELHEGRALAHWHNSRGEARYERPRHHALSIYLRGGEGTSRQVNGKPVSRGFPGAVCLFPAGSQSRWRIEGAFDFVHFYFTDDDLSRCIETTWDREPGAIRLEERYQIEDEVMAHAGRLIDMSEWQTGAPLQAMDHMAHWFMVQIAGRYTATLPEPPVVSGRFSPTRQRQLARWIEEDLGTPLDLATLAGWLNLSPYHFARLFRASFGMAPYQYIQERRLQKSRALLQQGSGVKVTAVALESGFGDASQFARAFRKRFGLSPSAFRDGI